MENSLKKVPDKGFTHGSKFHSDDVFTTAFLRILNPNIQVERGFAVPEDFDGIAYDIGFGKYDHHQADKEYRENGVPYAAFGLVWREFGSLLFDEEEVAKFDEKFIQPLDESDNTGCANMLAKIIADFNPGWDEETDSDTAFWKAEAFAETILRNYFDKTKGIERAKDLVKKAMEESDGTILVLPKFAPWKSVVVESTYKYVVNPSNRGGYNIQGVPVSKEDQTLVCPFPEEWRGKTAEELKKLTGIATLRFCHASGFLCAVETFEDAIQTAKLSLELAEKMREES